jgi:hypothetical protein
MMVSGEMVGESHWPMELARYFPGCMLGTVGSDRDIKIGCVSFRHVDLLNRT